MISLDGTWQFAVDSQRIYSVESINEQAQWRKAVVPQSWQAQFEDLRDYQGVAWYRKSVTLPGVGDDECVLLQFDAVDYKADVYLNGKLAGSHEGGYTPFELDISSLIRNGANEILVQILDPQSSEEGTEGISYWQIPHGKQSWYVQTSGIWQSARLLIKPKRHIRRALLTPTIVGKVRLDLQVSAALLKGKIDSVNIRILDPNKKEIIMVNKRIWSGVLNYSFELYVANLLLWSPDQPNLYIMELTFGEDKASERFGFRSFETKDKKFYLNGEPVYIMAALDQDFYPETVYTTPSEDHLRDEMLKAKKIGLNMLRCHIKAPDPRYLKVADEVGLLIWYEVPNWDVFSDESAKRGSQTLDEMLTRDWNHPSLVVLSIINESWGVDLQKAEQREWLKKEYERVKQMAVGRLVVDNSACWGNFHVKTDINDYHTYWAIPENSERFTETVRDVASRPKWLFSSFGDAEETGDEPLMISEFGNWGLPKLPAKLPFWFKRDFYGREVTLPAGHDVRFKQFALNKIFDSYNELAEESQRAQFRALKWEIEEIRLQQPIQGYVITEFTDINWECNGLLDMWRNLKIYADELADIQQQDALIPRPQRFTYWNDEPVKLDLWLSHYSTQKTDDSKVLWRSSDGAAGQMVVPQLSRMMVTLLPAIEFTPGIFNQAQKIRINFEWQSADGKLLARNYSEVFIFPQLIADIRPICKLYDPTNAMPAFKIYLEKNQPVNAAANQSVILSNSLDETVLSQLLAGAKVICLVDTATRLPESFPFKIQSRAAETYDGNWASNFNWLRNESPLFKSLAFSGSFGFESAHSAPRLALTEIAPELFNDVLAGMFIGWLHLNSGYIVQMRAGQGRLIVCALPLAQTINDDPFAASLFNRMIKYISGRDFNPKMEWKIE